MGFIDMGARSHAEYLAIAEKKATLMPANVTFEQAVACLEGAFYAISGLQRIGPRAGTSISFIDRTSGEPYVERTEAFINNSWV